MRKRITGAFVLIFVFIGPTKSFSYIVSANSIGEKYKTRSANILRGLLGHTTICMTEGLSEVPRSSLYNDIDKQKVLICSSQGLRRTGIYMVEQASGWTGAWAGTWIARCIIPPEGRPNVLMAFSTIMMGTTASTVGTGKILGQEGSFTGALIGSALGSVIAYGSIFIPHPFNPYDRPEFFPHLYLPPFISMGAVMGYNYEALKSNKMELLCCLIGCVVADAALCILAYRYHLY